MTPTEHRLLTDSLNTLYKSDQLTADFIKHMQLISDLYTGLPDISDET